MAAYAPDQDQLDALALLWSWGQRGDCSGERVAAKLLLGLYNGTRFPFDLTELRRLDESLLRAALLVIEMDACPAAEVHVLLGRIYNHPRGDFGNEFEARAYELGLKGRCKKAYLAPRASLQSVERV